MAAAGSVRPIVPGDSFGGPSGNRLTKPPSWSVAIKSGGLPPARAAACSPATSARAWERLVTLPPKRMTSAQRQVSSQNFACMAGT